jgi:CubicO group peptidase (beta-lactamase class C family)
LVEAEKEPMVFAGSLIDHPLWHIAARLAEEWTQSGRLTAIAVRAGRGKGEGAEFSFGRRLLDGAPGSLPEDAIFLVASITKPLVAMGVLQLVERGELLLGTKVHEVIPEFGHRGSYRVTIRHLLTHSSGLPDMLPDNLELRQARASLQTFLEGTCRVEFDFPTGQNSVYSSMGFVLLGEIIHRVSGLPAREYLQREFFGPLGMADTALGTPDDWYTGTPTRADRLVEVRVPDSMRDGHEWNWNSRYWRSLGAPWGGLLTTPIDLSHYARMMLGRGQLDGTRVLSPAAVEIATRNQLDPLREIPETVRRCKGWGLGWRLHWPAHSANFGDLLGPNAYGHWGATGTLLWMDPDTASWCVILSTEPQEPHGTDLARLSNLIAASLSEVAETG